jgi:uncharacterized membrane protein
MNPLILAPVAALAYSLNNFFTKLGIEESNPHSAIALNVTFNALGLWALVAFFSPVRPFFSFNVWPFILAGIFAPCLARSLLFNSYKHMGMARSDVIAGAMPLFALILAVVLIGERPSGMAIAGTFGIVIGVGLLSYKREKDMSWARWAILLPLGSALFFALRDIASKTGLELLPFPMTGAAITATVAAVILNFPYLFPGRRKKFVLNRKSLFFVVLGGFMVTAAYLSLFTALSGGKVSLVSPLVGMFPLFSLTLSFLFLRSKERITWKVVWGALLVVAGASSILIS